eukprot:2586682-Pleurochrysis_carterae.AAC.1
MPPLPPRARAPPRLCRVRGARAPPCREGTSPPPARRCARVRSRHTPVSCTSASARRARTAPASAPPPPST